MSKQNSVYVVDRSTGAEKFRLSSNLAVRMLISGMAELTESTPECRTVYLSDSSPDERENMARLTGPTFDPLRACRAARWLGSFDRTGCGEPYSDPFWDMPVLHVHPQ
jgi:hypothetical protein